MTAARGAPRLGRLKTAKLRIDAGAQLYEAARAIARQVIAHAVRPGQPPPS